MPVGTLCRGWASGSTYRVVKVAEQMAYVEVVAHGHTPAKEDGCLPISVVLTTLIGDADC